MKEDEITWQSIINELVKEEGMSPWDVNLSILSKKFLDTLKKMQEANLFVSGKVILAAAILLRMKSSHLVDEDLPLFDLIINPPEEDLYDDAESFYAGDGKIKTMDIPKLAVKSPQRRKKNVTVNDLIYALQKALNVQERRLMRELKYKSYEIPSVPVKKIDLEKVIIEIYKKITSLFKKKEDITFSGLVNSDSKEDKIFTFVPLLHLDNQNKVNLVQDKPFGEIKIKEPDKLISSEK